jgi:hypothetical protein
MQELGRGWQDFLCANHSRNLHFDTFSRGYSGYVKERLGDGLAVARLRCGGRLRIEPDGEAFIRSISKITHVGPKQYAKGDASPLPFLQPTPFLGHVVLTPSLLPTSGDGIQFHDFCSEHFPDLVNQCVENKGRTKQTVILSRALTLCHTLTLFRTVSRSLP